MLIDNKKQNIEKLVNYHIKIYTKNKVNIHLINNSINQRIKIWNKIDKHKLLGLTKKLSIQKIEKQKLTLFKSPHVHKKAKKSYEEVIYKINILIIAKEKYNNLTYSVLKTSILKNLPKAEKITYKKTIKGKNYINAITLYLLKQNLKKLYKAEIFIFRKLKKLKTKNIKIFILLDLIKNLTQKKLGNKIYKKYLKLLLIKTKIEQQINNFNKKILNL